MSINDRSSVRDGMPASSVSDRQSSQSSRESADSRTRRGHLVVAAAESHPSSLQPRAAQVVGVSYELAADLVEESV